MSTHRMTISVPHYIYNNLREHVQPRQMSRFIVGVLERKIISLKTTHNSVNDFFALRNILPKKNRKDILAAIKKGRV